MGVSSRRSSSITWSKDNGITLEHVSYSYDGKKNALNDVSLSIKPGQTVALVGSSGGGKTTLANIVTRFFDPQKGRVLIGNIDICDIPKETLMNIRVLAGCWQTSQNKRKPAV